MMEIRSYRRVFDLERRVYSIDSLRLNPGGVPVRGIVYCAAIVVLGAVAERIPVLHQVAYLLPWYLRDIGAPIASATLLGMVRLEGRTFHVAAMALGRRWLAPRLLSQLRPCVAVGHRWYPEEILFMPDGSDSRMRGMRYVGPGAVVVKTAHERIGEASGRRAAGILSSGGRAALILRPCAGGGTLDRAQVVLLGAGTRMIVRSQAKRGRR